MPAGPDEGRRPLLEDPASEILGGRRGRSYRGYFVNQTPFTVSMATFAVLAIGMVLYGASMLVTGTAKEAKSLKTGELPKDLHDSDYGATHAGVGFANYVVGNEVAKFWKSETGHGKKTKMSDPFAGFLLHKKKQSSGTEDAAQSTAVSDTPTTFRALQHAQDVANQHRMDAEDANADKGAQHLLRLIRTGTSSKNGAPPHLHPGMFREARTKKDHKTGSSQHGK